MVPAHQELLERFSYFRALFSANFAPGEKYKSGVIHILPQMNVNVLQVVLHLLYSCDGTACPTIDQLESRITTPHQTAELLHFMDFIADDQVVPFHQRLLQLAKRVVTAPSDYPSLMRRLTHGSHSSFLCQKWLGHLLRVPFTRKFTSAQRAELVRGVMELSPDVRDRVIQYWIDQYLPALLNQAPGAPAGMKKSYSI